MRLSIFGFDPLAKKSNPVISKDTKVVVPNEIKKPVKKSFFKFALLKNKLVVLFIACLLTFVSLIIYVSVNKGFGGDKVVLESYDGLPFNKSKFEQGVFVGNVTVHWEDLLRRYEILYDNSPENWSNLANWKNVLNQVNSEAILQNEGARKGLFESKDNSTLDPIKVNRARNYFDSKGKEYISGEAITVWFYNEQVPSIGLVPAKETALKFISDVRSKILSNEITMKSAGDLISSNFSLSSIVPAYQSNAYMKFTYISPDQSVFHDDYLDKTMWDLKAGETSEILTGHDYSGDAKFEAFFIVLKISEKTSSKEFPFKSSDQIIRKRILEGYKLEL